MNLRSFAIAYQYSLVRMVSVLGRKIEPPNCNKIAFDRGTNWAKKIYKSGYEVSRSIFSETFFSSRRSFPTYKIAFKCPEMMS